MRQECREVVQLSISKLQKLSMWLSLSAITMRRRESQMGKSNHNSAAFSSQPLSENAMYILVAWKVMLHHLCFNETSIFYGRLPSLIFHIHKPTPIAFVDLLPHRCTAVERTLPNGVLAQFPISPTARSRSDGENHSVSQTATFDAGIDS